MDDESKFVLTKVSEGPGFVAYRMGIPGTRMESTDLIFTSSPLDARIIITGDFEPGKHTDGRHRQPRIRARVVLAARAALRRAGEQLGRRGLLGRRAPPRRDDAAAGVGTVRPTLQDRLRRACERVTALGEEARGREASALATAAEAAHARESAAVAHRIAAATLARGLRGTGRGLSRLGDASPGPAVLVAPAAERGTGAQTGGEWRVVLRRAV